LAELTKERLEAIERARNEAPELTRDLSLPELLV